MGNSSSADAAEAASKKQRNHSIVEFDHLMEPTMSSAEPLNQGSSRSTVPYSPSADATVPPPDGSVKLGILKKAKESGSFVSKRDLLNMGLSHVNLDTKADSSVTISQPLRNIPPPSAEGDVVHPAKWLWKHPELTLCMDEHGNTYYYNYNTQESSWDPPADLSLPQAEITFRVTIPEGSRPGEVFTVEVNGTPLEVMCPAGLAPGQVLELSNDTPLYAASNEPDQPADWGGENGGIAEAEEEVREWMDGDEVGTGDAAVAAVAAAATPPPTAPATVDDETLWGALAEVAGVDIYSIKSDAELSRSTLTEVANGSYFPELIYRVGWAYKFNLLKSAAAACYLSGGDFLDSSQYDNCDGTPRYENAGFVEWLGDLRAQRVAMEEAIQAGALESMAQSGDGYALLERLSLSGDEGKLVEGIIARKQQVDRDLDNYRSRVLAIVSVDGGPSRESLDSVFGLLKGNVQCGAHEEPMDNDEMEEEVSNLLQDRHKFVVDILLTVVLLEEELDALTQSIEEFEARQRAVKDRAKDGAAVGEEEEEGAPQAGVDEEAQRLVEQHRAELRQRREELEQKKAEQLRVLGERLGRTRGVIAYVAELLAAAVRRVSGGEEKAVDTVSMRGLEEALQVEFAEEASAIEAETAAEERHAALVADEALASNQLILDHERELQRLKASLDETQELQRAALKERLAKKRAERVKELLEEGAAATPEEAEVRAAAEVAAEEEVARAAIASDAAEKLKQFTDASLASIKSAADTAAQRLEDSLNSLKSEQQRGLMKRLERRRRECERRVETVAAAAGASLSPAQKEAMLASALARVESASEEEAALLEAHNLAAVRAVRAQMVHLVRSEHEKECERLETELLAQKDKRVKDLKSRLEKKKAERAKEILADAGNKGVTSAVAVALANEEVSAEEKQALATIASETDARMEDARKAVLANLVDLHQKESARLEEDMKYQENMQRANLVHRLERQRKAKERELQAAVAAAGVRLEPGSSGTSLEPLTPESIRERVEAEMAAVAQQEEQILQQALLGLKEQQQKEATQLADELTYKKTSADKRLKDRLAQRAAKAAQIQQAPLQPVEATVRSPSPEPLDRLSPLSSLAQVLPPAVEAGSMTAEELVGALKEKHKRLLSRLDMFIQFEKTAVTAQKQALVRSAGTKQKSEAALSDLAKTAILFDHLAEFVALGLKKTLLYETKAVKDAVARSRAESGAGAGADHRLSAAEVCALQALDCTAAARAEATERVLERFQRDIVGLVDSQAVQRRGTVAELRSNGSSVTAVQNAMREMSEYHGESVLNELEKALITLTGVWISPEALCETATEGGNGTSTRVTSPGAPAATEEDPAIGSDEDEEDTELFLSKKRASTIDLNRLKQRSAFGPRIIRWFSDLLTLLQLYASAPAVMILAFERSCAELKFLRTGSNAHLVELSAELRSQMLKPMLTTLVHSFTPLMRDSAPAVLPLTLDAAAEAATKVIQASFQGSAVDPPALFAQTKAQHYDPTTGKDALCAELLSAYSAALQAYIGKPVLTAAELSRAQEVALKAETPASQSKRVGEVEARKIKLVQAISSGADKLKAALREKYRKIGGNEAMLERELGELDRALQEVTDMVSDERIHLDEINADGLVAVVERKAQGETLGAEDVAEVQREVERQKAAQRAQKDVQRVLQTATESENRLGVALKIEQAKRQQALQNRLLNKKKKSD